MTNRRQHYRIVIPQESDLLFRFRENLSILDLSEVAARVEMSGMKTGDQVVLGFPILDAMLMRPGIVYRAVPGETVVLLDRPLRAGCCWASSNGSFGRCVRRRNDRGRAEALAPELKKRVIHGGVGKRLPECVRPRGESSARDRPSTRRTRARPGRSRSLSGKARKSSLYEQAAVQAEEHVVEAEGDAASAGECLRGESTRVASCAQDSVGTCGRVAPSVPHTHLGRARTCFSRLASARLVAVLTPFIPSAWRSPPIAVRSSKAARQWYCAGVGETVLRSSSRTRMEARKRVLRRKSISCST